MSIMVEESLIASINITAHADTTTFRKLVSKLSHTWKNTGPLHCANRPWSYFFYLFNN